jgi:hypothetical protein
VVVLNTLIILGASLVKHPSIGVPNVDKHVNRREFLIDRKLADLCSILAFPLNSLWRSSPTVYCSDGA